MSNVIDLDILRPAKKLVKIGGREIDISFIPCGITFDLDKIVRELVNLDTKKIQSDEKEMKHAFDLGIRLCAVFCSHKFPEMNEAWFLENASADQINAFTQAIQAALMESYEGVGRHSKN
jgi:hypothetical protein